MHTLLDDPDRDSLMVADMGVWGTGAFENDAASAEKLATDPIGPLPDGIDPRDAAAWTVVGNVLLNLDETLARP